MWFRCENESGENTLMRTPESIRREMEELKEAVTEAKHKLDALEEVRKLLSESTAETAMYELFEILLCKASEIREEADALADALGVLEDELSEAKWMARAGAGPRLYF